jgi:uracil-DNA glycosylase
MLGFNELEKSIVQCTRCRRLRSYCADVARKRKPEFHDFAYWGKPVPGFGDRRARVWIVGLAPGAHGANRTGRMFTGDSSGRWLYRALFRCGFSDREISLSRTDGLILKDIYISATARCAPPQNKPSPEEISNCERYLDAEFALLKEVKFFLALGAIGFKSTLQLLTRQGLALPRPLPKFKHNSLCEVGPYTILSCYHPSRQNTQTGLLTEPMWFGVFDRLKALLEPGLGS